MWKRFYIEERSPTFLFQKIGKRFYIMELFIGSVYFLDVEALLQRMVKTSADS